MSLKTVQLAGKGDIEGTYVLPCMMWAEKCIVVNQPSLDEAKNTYPLHPFIALGRFLIAGQLLIPYDDAIMESLRCLVKSHIDTIFGNIHPFDVLANVIKDKEKECDELLDMISNCLWQDMEKKVQGYKTATQQLKCKFALIDTRSNASNSTETSNSSTTSNNIGVSNSSTISNTVIANSTRVV